MHTCQPGFILFDASEWWCPAHPMSPLSYPLRDLSHLLNSTESCSPVPGHIANAVLRHILATTGAHGKNSDSPVPQGTCLPGERVGNVPPDGPRFPSVNAETLHICRPTMTSPRLPHARSFQTVQPSSPLELPNPHDKAGKWPSLQGTWVKVGTQGTHWPFKL